MLSEKIREYRTKFGLTQEQLADMINVTKATVSKWELEQSLPDIMMLPKLASIFGITIDELMDYQPDAKMEEKVSYHATLPETNLTYAHIYDRGKIGKIWLTQGGIPDENGGVKEWVYRIYVNFDFNDPALLEEIQKKLPTDEYMDILESRSVNGRDTENYHLWVCRDEILRFRTGCRPEIKKATLRLIEKGIMSEDDLY